MMFHRLNGAAVGLAAAMLVTPAMAASNTSEMTVSLTVEDECTISAGNLAFSSAGIISSNIDNTANLTIECTDDSAYQVALSGTPGSRALTSGSNTVSYDLYQDAERSVAWGATQGTNTVDGTADGTAQTLTVYGRVASGQTVAAGTYTDTVTATIWYGDSVATTTTTTE